MTRSKARRGNAGGRRAAPVASRSTPEGEHDSAQPTIINPDDEKRDDLLQKADMKNAKLEAYYRKQIGVEDDEWNRLMDVCREPLPSTFRISGSRKTAAVLTSVMEKTYIPHLSGVEFDGEPVPPPIPLPWYPKGLAWQLNVPKKVLRKSPEFKKFHSFLVFETEVGNITRQEAVSMLPPLFLDVEPHHKVLDMCAAPGSKTSQLLESLHSSPSLLESCIPPGLLVANDSDYKRTHLLIHQSARLPSPAFMVTNVDASIFPTLSLPPEFAADASRSTALHFDRILCDVPCSGDGTIRKNVGIWKKWSPMDGNGLHGLQLRILQRAMKMLHHDGKIVYSTCSLNPVENEAVVAEALRTAPGFELVDVSDSMPSLVRRPGLTKWLPTATRDLEFFDTYDEYIASLPGGKGTARLIRSHWPPTEDLGLERCMRIYPHLQDTGGFFVAVLRRKPSTKAQKEGKRVAEEVPDEPELKKPRIDGDAEDVQMVSPVDYTAAEPIEEEPAADPPAPAEASASALKAQEKLEQPQRQKKRSAGDSGFKEMPYTFVSPSDPIVENCIRQLSLTPTFPATNLLVRNPAGEPARSLYLTNDLVRAVLSANDFRRVRVMTAGTKIFTRQEGGFGRKAADTNADDRTEARAPLFRLLSEGLPVVLPYLRPESIVDTDVRALRQLLEAYYPLLAAFDAAFLRDVGAKSAGSHVVRFRAGEFEGATLTHDLVLPIWKSASSISLMIDKKAKSALSLRVFGEDLTVAGREAAEKQKGRKPRGGDALAAAGADTGDGAAVVDTTGTPVPEPSEGAVGFDADDATIKEEEVPLA